MDRGLESPQGKEENPWEGIDHIVTAEGSIYKFLEDGRTQRTKIRGERKTAQEFQDLLVFVDFPNDEKWKQYQHVLHSMPGEKPKRLYVVDEKGNVIRTNDQAHKAGQLRLVITNPEKTATLDAVKCTIIPALGLVTYDQRSFVENGQNLTERHLGNKVIEIVKK